MSGKYLSYEDAAEHLGVSRRFLEKLVAERRIPYLRLGGKVRFLVEDLDAYALAGRVEAVALDPGHAFAARRNSALRVVS